MAIEWTPDLTLNHPGLDTDHVELFRKLAAAGAALSCSPSAVDEAMAVLCDAFLAHTAREDALMTGTGYPEREAHRAAHDFFLAALAQLRAALARRAPTADDDDWLRTRAPEWLRFHVRVNDAPLVAWLFRRRERPLPEEGVARRRS